MGPGLSAKAWVYGVRSELSVQAFGPGPIPTLEEYFEWWSSIAVDLSVIIYLSIIYFLKNIA